VTRPLKAVFAGVLALLTLKPAYDAIVCEAGFAGVAAAIELRRLGLSVLLVEPRTAAGWEATRALHLDWTAGDSAVTGDFARRAQTMGGLKKGRLDAPICEFVLDDMLADAGVDLLLMSRVVGLAVSGGVVRAVRIASKSGEVPVSARLVVDASRAGAVAALAGATPAPPASTQSTFTVMLNRVQDNASAPPSLAGHNVAVRPSVWPGEAAVEFRAATQDLARARQAVPKALAALRRASAAFKDAVVTNMSLETWPLAWPSLPAQSLPVRNLFIAGPAACGQPGQTLAAFMDHGAAVAAQAAQAAPSLPPAPAAPANTSLDQAPLREADVVVAGGGTAGPYAAIAAARRGARVVLLEQGACLGGMGTAGGIHVYYHGVPGGLQDEVDRLTQQIHPAFAAAPFAHDRIFHPDARKVVLEKLALEAGVTIVYGATLVRVLTEDLPSRLPATAAARPAVRATGVVAATPAGLEAWRCKVVIDSTGDGDAAALAGAEFTFGRETDGLPHAYSLSAGMMSDQRGLFGLNFDAGFCDPTDVVDMTRARRRGLAHLRRDAFTPENRYLYIAPLLGLRNARQIVGDYRLTFADQIEGRQFADVIAYAYSHYDNHALDYENESDASAFWVWALGLWRRPIGCEIPYRCLLPRNVEGMLVACRAISITQDAHHQLRMQRDMQRLGEAAGVAAALSSRLGFSPRQLDVRLVQAELIASGALGKPEPKQLPAPTQAAQLVHETAWKPLAPLQRPVPELVAALEGPDARDAVWRLAQAGQAAAPALAEALKSDNPDKRYWAAVALAGLDSDAGAGTLLEALRGRHDGVEAARHKSVPRWQAAIPLLGRLRCRQAVADLCALLADSSTPLDVLIAATRALGRIGDPAAAGAIEAMTARPDLPAQRFLQISAGVVKPLPEDCRWQIDVAAADALLKLNVLRPALLERHLHDDRLLVRRCAQKVLDAIRLRSTA